MYVSINRVPATAGPYVTLDLVKLFAEPPSENVDRLPVPATGGLPTATVHAN